MELRNVLLGTLAVVAALVATAPAQAQRYGDERYEDARYERYEDERYEDERYYDERYYDERYDEERYDDERYDDERYEDERYEDRRYGDQARYEDDYAWARVVDIDPIVAVATRPVEKQQCTRAPAARRPPAAEGILASVLATPSRDGSNAAATAGPRRCTTRTEYVREERVTGYDVAYVYRGRSYSTVTSRPPGDRIRIAVNHHPAR